MYCYQLDETQYPDPPSAASTNKINATTNSTSTSTSNDPTGGENLEKGKAREEDCDKREAREAREEKRQKKKGEGIRIMCISFRGR